MTGGRGTTGLMATRPPGCLRPRITLIGGAPGSNAAEGATEAQNSATATRQQSSERFRRAACSLVPVYIGGDPTVTVTCGGQDMPTAASFATSTTRFGKNRRRWRRRRCIFCTPHRGCCPPTIFAGCVLALWSTRITGWKQSRWLRCAVASCAVTVPPSSSLRRCSMECTATRAAVRCLAERCGRKMGVQIEG